MFTRSRYVRTTHLVVHDSTEPNPINLMLLRHSWRGIQGALLIVRHVCAPENKREAIVIGQFHPGPSYRLNESWLAFFEHRGTHCLRIRFTGLLDVREIRVATRTVSAYVRDLCRPDRG